MAINKENMLTWVEALESGEYNQCKGTLVNRFTNYCCIGVAAELAGAKKEPSGIDGHPFFKNGYEEVSNWLGFEFSREWAGEEGVEGTLIDFNDSNGYTFPEIAAYLRETYL